MSWLKYLKILIKLIPCIKLAHADYTEAIGDDEKVNVQEGVTIALNFVECVMKKLELGDKDKDNLLEMIQGLSKISKK